MASRHGVSTSKLHAAGVWRRGKPRFKARASLRYPARETRQPFGIKNPYVDHMRSHIANKISVHSPPYLASTSHYPKSSPRQIGFAIEQLSATTAITTGIGQPPQCLIPTTVSAIGRCFHANCRRRMIGSIILRDVVAERYCADSSLERRPTTAEMLPLQALRLV